MDISELKKIIEGDKAVYGINETLKLIKKKSISEVILASNIPEEIRKRIVETKIEIKECGQNNKELGEIAKKFFNLSVIGVKNK
jgi:ribosomal protein L30E